MGYDLPYPTEVARATRRMIKAHCVIRARRRKSHERVSSAVLGLCISLGGGKVRGSVDAVDNIAAGRSVFCGANDEREQQAAYR